MQSFKDIEELVSYMFDKLNGDECVSVVADKDLTVAIVQELLAYKNVILDFADIDIYIYDKEYLVSLYGDTDTDYWHVSIEQIYNYEKEKYLGTDRYVLFHEDVNSKALVDMKENENIKLSGYDWFVIGEDDGTDNEESEELEPDINNLTVNGKHVSVDEYNKFVSKFAPDKVIKTNDKPSATSTISKESYRVNGKEVDKETYKKELAKFEQFQDRYLDNIRDMLLRYASFMDDWNDLLRLFY